MTVRLVFECRGHDTVEVPGSSPVVPTNEALVRSNPAGASPRSGRRLGGEDVPDRTVTSSGAFRLQEAFALGWCQVAGDALTCDVDERVEV